MNRGFLVVFSGIDGSGKSTQAKLLINGLKQEGLDISYVYNRWEPFLMRPFISIWNRKVKKKSSGSKTDVHRVKVEDRKLKLKNPLLRQLWFFLFFIDYGLQLCTRIRIPLFNKKLIVSDRIFYDSLIDKAADLGKSEEWLIKSTDSLWVKLLFPHPDIVIYVDCPQDIAFSRKRDIPDISYLSDRRKMYLPLSERYGWFKVDGTQPVEDVALKIKDEVLRSLKNI